VGKNKVENLLGNFSPLCNLILICGAFSSAFGSEFILQLLEHTNTRKYEGQWFQWTNQTA
jgi:3-mercaptopyruvate sulfurtransferase SseA